MSDFFAPNVTPNVAPILDPSMTSILALAQAANPAVERNQAQSPASTPASTPASAPAPAPVPAIKLEVQQVPGTASPPQTIAEPTFPWFALSLFVAGLMLLLAGVLWQRLRPRLFRTTQPQRPNLTSLNPNTIAPTPTSATPLATRDEVLLERARKALSIQASEIQHARRVARELNLPVAASVLLVPSLRRRDA